MSKPDGIYKPRTMDRHGQNIRDCGKDVEEEVDLFLKTHAGRYQRDQMAIDLDLIVRKAFGNGARSSRYIINKSSRYSSQPYSGFECASAGVERGKTYYDHEQAIADASRLSLYNGVEFKVLNLEEVLHKESQDRIFPSRVDRITADFNNLDPDCRLTCVLGLIGLLSDEAQDAIRKA